MTEFKAIGRRKSSVAKVILTSAKGEESKVTVNGKAPNKYFPNSIIIQDMEQPLNIVKEKAGAFNVKVKVSGSGFSGQAGAIKLAISRALIEYNADLKPMLKVEGLTTRDARSKERKKAGKYGARRSHQFVKR